MQKIEHFLSHLKKSCNDPNACSWTIGMEKSMIKADTIKRFPNDSPLGIRFGFLEFGASDETCPTKLFRRHARGLCNRLTDCFLRFGPSLVQILILKKQKAHQKMVLLLIVINRQNSPTEYQPFIHPDKPEFFNPATSLSSVHSQNQSVQPVPLHAEIRR